MENVLSRCVVLGSILLVIGCGGSSTDVNTDNPIQIESQPGDQFIGLGGTAVFSVEASQAEDEELSYQWSRDDEEISGATERNYSFSNITLDDDGATFSVRVQNASGNVAQSQEATLTVSTGTFSYGIDLGEARWNHTATILDDGNVLVAGGRTPNLAIGFGATEPMNRAEIWDQSTNAFVAVGSLMVHARSGHRATKLSDGDVILCGDWVPSLAAANSSCEVFDAGSSTFAATAETMLSPRAGHTQSLLDDGNLLVVGGRAESSALASPSAEIYRPTTSSFHPTVGSMNTARTEHTIERLADGRFIVIGGRSLDTAPLDTLEIYDPATDSFALAPFNLAASRYAHESVTLSDGNILIVGGWTTSTEVAEREYAMSLEVIDPNTWETVAMLSLSSPFINHQVLLTANGDVLISGVPLPEGSDASALVYDHVSRQIAPTAEQMRHSRTYHTAIPRDDGSIFLIGGLSSLVFNMIASSLQSTEIYSDQ
ncbi:MAG: kelch repeat-containing protein [Pseudomonadota bacterium]